MTLLPARIPEIPEDRAGIVPARLARKVGPLFGVTWEDGPFGPRTWVSDHSRITLSEIARGAPQPTRSQSVRPAAGEVWGIIDRVGVTAQRGNLPNEIANATLNRFGPDTRSAVLLTAVNRLLDPVRRSIDDALSLLRDATGAPLDPELRLAAWAALVVETFRSQPALVAAGTGARTVQRELMSAWDLPRADSLGSTPFTRCEISSSDRPRSPSQPNELELVDATFAALGLDDPSGPELARRLRHDEIVDRLLRRLRAAGSLQDSSHLWLSERRPGEVVVEALVPPTRLVHEFVGQVLPATPDPPLPRPPDAATLGTAPPLSRRATLLALLGVVRHVLATPRRRERHRTGAVEVAERTAELAESVLADDDPVRAVVRCRAALIIVQCLRHSTEHDLSAPLNTLLTAAGDCIDAYRAGSLDRGATAEILGAANIEINAIRRHNAGRQPGLPSPGVLDERLRASWRVWFDAVELDPGRVTEPGPGMVGFHLHNYAAFLASHPGSPEDLALAMRLYRSVVIPARQEFRDRGGPDEPLRHALQIASRAAGAQAAAALAEGSPERARGHAAEGLGWIRSVLEEPGTDAVLTATTEQAYRLALLAAPAVLLAAELDAPGTRPDDRALVAELLGHARRWERSTPAGVTGTHARHVEIEDLQRRLDALVGPETAEPRGEPEHAHPPR
ncbi:hypothetical protein [Pseudonocardia sp. ICBG1034]|uniref:hypothetical protein n=1 Tax=Pseudonocardia sp. ICBG1034 TaxID=2844381 RepID=UPI001CCD0C3C|nr:hypothetical protein [Pseudonocardia sp. ICBG1034]